MKLDHIAIAVFDLEEAKKMYRSLLNVSPSSTEYIASQDVSVSCFKTGEFQLELIATATEDHAISIFLHKNGTGVHHLAFEVSDLTKEIKRLEKEGFRCIDPIPKRGANGKEIVFLHPKTTKGVLIELVRKI